MDSAVTSNRASKASARIGLGMSRQALHLDFTFAARILSEGRKAPYCITVVDQEVFA
jgi:hypothetical protein